MLLLNANMCFAMSSNRAKLMNGSNFNGYASFNIVGYDASNCHYGSTNGYNAGHVIVGGGDTPVTKEDYDMADTSILGNDKLRSIKQTATYNGSNGAVLTTSWRNDSASPITVKEIGAAYKVNAMAYDKAYNILLARKVLDSPVTIQPGETYVFSYNFKIA